MKEKTKGYGAGIMDAEGCIRLAKQVKDGRAHYSPRVYISNQSRLLMNWLVLHYGGQYVRNINNNKGLDWYIWYLQSRPSVLGFLGLISPYLKQKKPQAALLSRFCSDYVNFSDEDKEQCFQELKRMKPIGSVTTDTHSDYKKADQSYLSAYFDGEGCVGVDRSQTPNRMSVSFHLSVRVTNTDLSMLGLFKQLYGGAIKEKGRSKCYDWRLYDRPTVEKFLLRTLPYLVIKKDEAKLALEYVRLGSHMCPEKREEIYKGLRRLKKSKIQSDLYGDVQSDDSESCQSINT